MKATEDLVLLFFQTTGCIDEYTAVCYIQQATSIDEAVLLYFENGMQLFDTPRNYKTIFANDMKEEIVVIDEDDDDDQYEEDDNYNDYNDYNNYNNFNKTNKTNETHETKTKTIKEIFEECQINGVVSDENENIQQFCEKLGIQSENSFELYYLSYLGECKESQLFEMKHIEKLMKFFGRRNNYKGYLKQKYNEMNNGEFYSFLSKIYDYLLIVLKRSENLAMIENSENNQNGENTKTTILDVIDYFYSDLLRKHYKSVVYNEVMDYMLNKHEETTKKKTILKDTFCFMPEFLEKFTTLNSLKMKETEIDNCTSFPTFYTDFLYYFNFEHH